MAPLVGRHHALVMLSEVIPKFPALRDTEITVTWHELDALTHVELAQVNLAKMQTDATGIAAGSLTPEDSRKRLATDKDSGFHGLGVDLETEPLPDLDDPAAAAEAARGGKYGAKADVEARGDGANAGRGKRAA